MTSDVEKVEQLARTAAGKAVAEDRAERRGFTITGFGRHGDGYWHARVTVDGKPIYMHRRYGSWMCPGEVNGRSMFKEVEAMCVGTSVGGKEIKEALQTKVRSIEKSERRENGEEREDSNAAETTDAEGDDGAGVPDASGAGANT